MKLEDIENQWDEDSKIDELNLIETTTRFAKLHSKYARIRNHELLVLESYQIEIEKLTEEKIHFLLKGDSQHPYAIERGWELPPSGRSFTRAEAERSIQADDHLTKMKLRIAKQRVKVKFLEEILKRIGTMSYEIRNIVEERKFQNGN